MVAGVAHEINNPLSFVSNNVAVLQRDIRGLSELLALYSQADAIIEERNQDLLAQIKDLASNLHSMSPAHVEFLTVPLLPGSFNEGAIGNVVKWDPVKSKRLFNDLTEDKPISKPAKQASVTIPPGLISLQVLNIPLWMILAHYGSSATAIAAPRVLRKAGCAAASTSAGPRAAFAWKMRSAACAASAAWRP